MLISLLRSSRSWVLINPYNFLIICICLFLTSFLCHYQIGTLLSWCICTLNISIRMCSISSLALNSSISRFYIFPSISLIYSFLRSLLSLAAILLRSLRSKVGVYPEKVRLVLWKVTISLPGSVLSCLSLLINLFLSFFLLSFSCCYLCCGFCKWVSFLDPHSYY